MKHTCPNWRLLLLLLSSAAAIQLGFLTFTPKQSEELIHRYGYFLLLATFVWFVGCLFTDWRQSRGEAGAAGLVVESRPWLRHWRVVVAIFGATALCLFAEPTRFKILYDEYVLQATAMHMHFTREVGTVVRGYNINEAFIASDVYLDKRPYFFAFLLSIVHDIGGYRPANVFVLNAVLVPVCLALLFLIARRLSHRAGGIMAVLAFGTMPLFAQNATGGGMELLNLAMILGGILLGTRCIERPTAPRLGAFVLGIALLAQTRYESALYVAPAAAVLGFVWWRHGKLLLPAPVLCAPLLLIPTALHNAVLSNNPVLWELPSTLESRFGAAHVANNLKHAGLFLFGFERGLPNSWCLSLLGCAGVVICLFRVLGCPQRVLRRPVRWVAICFAVGIGMNLLLLMFYFWGELDDPMVWRLSLPLCALLACAAAAAAGYLDHRIPATRFATMAVLLAVPIIYGRVVPLHLYTSQNLIEHELRWERSWLEKRRLGGSLIMTNKSSLPWLIHRTPAILISRARVRQQQLERHLAEGTFPKLIVTQRLRATSVRGDFQVDPDDELPKTIRLRTLAEKRFGATLDRISEVVGIENDEAMLSGQ